MSETQETQKPAPKEPAFILLGALGFDTLEQVDAFTAGLDIQGSIYTLIQAANFAQAKGCFNLTEASLIAKSIRNIVRKNDDGDAQIKGS